MAMGILYFLPPTTKIVYYNNVKRLQLYNKKKNTKTTNFPKKKKYFS